MTPAETFQARHGARWAAIANGPELTDALLTVNASVFAEILDMPDAVIASASGNVILARLKGQLIHERDLINLSVLRPDPSSDLPPETYPDPAEEQLEAEDERDADTSGAGPLAEWISPEPPPESPKPKKRKYTKRKKSHAT